MCDHTSHREAATLTVRVIKSFDYGTLKCIAVRGEHGINLDTCTVRQLKDIITARTWPRCLAHRRIHMLCRDTCNTHR